MSARSDDLARIQEIYDVVVRTQSQLDALGFTRERFLDPQNDADDLLAEGFMNRVLRVKMCIRDRDGEDGVPCRGRAVRLQPLLPVRGVHCTDVSHISDRRIRGVGHGVMRKRLAERRRWI